MQRSEDHDKARFLVAKAEEEQASSGPGAGSAASKALDKRRRLEEEAKNKVRVAGGAARCGKPHPRPLGPSTALSTGLLPRGLPGPAGSWG